MTKYTRVQITWLDAQMTNQSQMSFNDVRNTQLIRTVTTGYLVFHSTEKVVVAGSYHEMETEDVFFNVLAIPQGCITKIKKI